MNLNIKFFNENFVKGIHRPEIPSFNGHKELLLKELNPDIEHSF